MASRLYEISVERPANAFAGIDLATVKSIHTLPDAETPCGIVVGARRVLRLEGVIPDGTINTS